MQIYPAHAKEVLLVRVNVFFIPLALLPNPTELSWSRHSNFIALRRSFMVAIRIHKIPRINAI